MTQLAPWYRPFLTAILVVVYVFSFIQEGHVHLHQHGEDQHALHDDHCDKDACHVAIYHHGATDCGHKAHIIPTEEPCYDCHELLQVQHLEKSADKEVTLEAYKRQEFSGMHLCELHSIRDLKARGPPFRSNHT